MNKNGFTSVDVCLVVALVIFLSIFIWSTTRLVNHIDKHGVKSIVDEVWNGTSGSAADSSESPKH